MDDAGSPEKASPLQALASDSSLAKLETGVEAGLHALSEIRLAFRNVDSVPEIAQWIEKINELQSQTASQRTVVGVVGSTGAGKSSVINAVLEEECLVPTSCMRACTAVITEIGYNDSEQEDEKYRAEVHFISREDWAKELRVLRDDMDADQASFGSEYTSSETSAIAYDKIRSVYPFLEHEEIKKVRFDVDELVEHPSVKDLLGSVQQVASATSEEFLSLLQRFIDSKEKSPSMKEELGDLEYWPLIRVVKIFVRSPVLKSGLVLVDLPGVQDSNAARDAVARNYIQECSGLWVVAPITRAADDRVAQNLLGDSFRRQLQFDGTYSRVTFICSKTDEIIVSEALKAVTEDHPAHQLLVQTELLEKERDGLEETISELQQRIKEADWEAAQCLSEVCELRAAINRSGDDDGILVSPQRSRKRAARTAAVEARKRQRRQLRGDNEDTDSCDEELSASEPEPEAQLEKERISREVAAERVEAAQARMHGFHDESNDLKTRPPPHQKDLKKLKREIRSAKTETMLACIRYRNDVVRPAIQSQFAQGIREIDQDNAAHDEDGDHSNQIQRDYAEIGQKLPVFCVSSKAYQTLSGRFQKDEGTAGFSFVEDTEIPALQRHAHGTAGEMRAVTCRRFLHDLGIFLSSLHLQIVLSDQPLKLADDLREKEFQFLADATGRLREELKQAVRETFMLCRTTLDHNLFKRFDSAAKVASDTAIRTVTSWICHRNEGGLAYTTFRATCARQGVFKGKKGQMDFNTALVEPMTKHFAQPWEYAFSRCLPSILDTLAENLGQILKSFRTQMQKRQQLTKASSFDLVHSNGRLLEKRFKDTAELNAILSSKQKDASRLPIDVIAGAMEDAYDHCAKESGVGCFTRIKKYIMDYVEQKRGTMFKDAARKMKTDLKAALDELEKALDKKVEDIVALISDDYTALLKDESIFKALTTVREDIRNLLARADEWFEQVLRGQADFADVSKSEEAQAMGVNNEAPAAGAEPTIPPSASASSRGTPVAATTKPSAATDVTGTVSVKAEPLSTAASKKDTTLRDV